MGVVCVTFRSVRMYGSVGCFFLDWKKELNMSPFDTRTFNSLEERAQVTNHYYNIHLEQAYSTLHLP